MSYLHGYTGKICRSQSARNKEVRGTWSMTDANTDVIRVSARVEVKWSSQESMLTLTNTHPLVHVHSLTVLLHI